ncbi:hypothetical protein D1AOALGA4SA_7030 [Olavius algarvensis Delta 1 endosymbiont]|nr:hypothetical protein D1AOALGA4SA_7030 [Olavius algarvensis Delta 1 endosymbiont]
MIREQIAKWSLFIFPIYARCPMRFAFQSAIRNPKSEIKSIRLPLSVF